MIDSVMTAENAAWVSAAIALILALITALYAFYTKKILDANMRMVMAVRDQIEAENRPYVTVRVEIRNYTFVLVIENSGKTTVHDLKIRLDKSFFMHGEERVDRDLSQFNIFTNTIESFSPSSIARFDLHNALKKIEEYNDKITPRIFSFTASYNGVKSYKETTTIDLSQFVMSVPAKSPPSQQDFKGIIQELRLISTAISSAAERYQASTFSPDVDDPH